MIMKTKFILLFLIALSLYSCKKKINGNLIDNFNNPVENAEVKIIDSDYHTRSDNSGNFSIDFSNGKFQIKFSKDFYLPIEKELYITDNKDYPLGEIMMYKIPSQSGVFYKDKYDFQKIPKLNFSYKENSKKTFFGSEVERIYSLHKDSCIVFQIKENEEVELYSTVDMRLSLMKPEGNKVGSLFYSRLGQVVKANKYPMESTHLVDSIVIHRFIPELNEIYVLVGYSENEIKQYMTEYGFGLKFIQKK